MNASHTTVSLNASNLPEMAEDDGVPEWVHLLPVREGAIQTDDRRGPYHITDADAIVRTSLQGAMGLVIDENHATDLAAPKGMPAPARGWINELEVRDDGIWGKVQWSEEGRALVASRAYRGLSPVIRHDQSKNIHRILRASLINKPNMRGLVALNHREDTMSFLAQLAAQLGLEDAATEADITGAITTLKGEGEATTALQSQMSDIGAALGVNTGGDVTAILAAAEAAGETAEDGSIVALQAEVATLTTSLNDERETRTRGNAETFVDGEIVKGRAGLKPMRDRYVSMHMKDPSEAETLIGAMPILNGSTVSDLPPETKDGVISLNASQSDIATMLGVTGEDYAKTLQTEQEARL